LSDGAILLYAPPNNRSLNKRAKVAEKQKKSRETLSRRFCVAPMMESKNSGQKTLLF
jgi:hypothetical protein